MYVGFEHTKAVINDGFYSFAQKRQKADSTSSAASKPDLALLMQRLAPIIPKVFLHLKPVSCVIFE